MNKFFLHADPFLSCDLFDQGQEKCETNFGFFESFIVCNFVFLGKKVSFT